MDKGHAFLPPSGAEQWAACAYWPTANRDNPESGDSEASAEGSAAHWVCEEALDGRECVVGQVAPNGVIIDQEMLDGAQLYFDVIADVATLNDVHVEETVQIERVDPTGNNWGTPDCWWYDAHRKHLHLFDYKYGFGYVEVFRNKQLLDYVAGILDTHNIPESATVSMTIVQPRWYGREGAVREWTEHAFLLRAYINDLLNAAGRALAPNPIATPGPQCEHCPGRHRCNALQRPVADMIDYSRQGEPYDLPPAELSLELQHIERAIGLLEARRTGLAAEAESIMRKGGAVPGLALEATEGRLAWTAAPEEVILTGQVFGVELGKPATVTPTQAVKAGVPKAIVDTMSARPPGKMKLVRVNMDKVSRLFS